MQISADTVVARSPSTPASTQDGTYPRPQMLRAGWADLTGQWGFDYDDHDEGLAAGWQNSSEFSRAITVPFPPESPASGIGETGFHPVVWYRRELTAADFSAAGLGVQGDRILIHFGAVDYRATVWLNGSMLGRHEGGHTPFSFDATTAIDLDSEEQSLVVRAEDDPHDVGQPRGKQDWQESPHSIWYHRTTGIWQPVWLEAVPSVAIETIDWTSDVPNGFVEVSVRLNRRAPGATVRVSLDFAGEPLGTAIVDAGPGRAQATIVIDRQRNGQDYENLLWSPQNPRLIDATVTLVADSSTDEVFSYLGMRSVAVENGNFLLNDRPCFVRSVLSQGYWPESHLASPSAAALETEARLIRDLGFNAARIHQKIEDPRFLYWADRLGILIWGEMPGAFEFSRVAMKRTIAEWTEAVERDRSHPSIVTWVPLNESWGVQHISSNGAVRDYSRTLFHLTKALDPTRPVVSNDGWEHLDTDIWSIHDYAWKGEILRARYADRKSVDELFTGMGPSDRRLSLSDEPDRGQPIMLTEFGGVKFGDEAPDGWGYSTAVSTDDYAERLGVIFDAIHASTVLAGFCYTQLTDTLQETNGLLKADRTPKLPMEQLRALIIGEE